MDIETQLKAQIEFENLMSVDKLIKSNRNLGIYNTLQFLDAKQYLPATFQIPLEFWDYPVIKGHNDAKTLSEKFGTELDKTQMRKLSLRSVFLLENMLNTYLSSSDEKTNILKLDSEVFPFLPKPEPTAENVYDEKKKLSRIEGT